jgi:hypothetical protein
MAVEDEVAAAGDGAMSPIPGVSGTASGAVAAAEAAEKVEGPDLTEDAVQKEDNGQKDDTVRPPQGNASQHADPRAGVSLLQPDSMPGEAPEPSHPAAADAVDDGGGGLQAIIQDTIAALRATLSSTAFGRCAPTTERLQRPKLIFLYRIISSVADQTGFAADLYDDNEGQLLLQTIRGGSAKPGTTQERQALVRRKQQYFQRIIHAVEHVVSDGPARHDISQEGPSLALRISRRAGHQSAQTCFYRGSAPLPASRRRRRQQLRPRPIVIGAASAPLRFFLWVMMMSARRQ